MAKQFLLFLLTVVYWVGGKARECTDANIDACVDPMKKYNLAETATTIAPNFNRSYLAELCKVYDGVEQCMYPIRPNCKTLQRHVYQGIEDHYNYICDETFEEYQRHRLCLATPTLHVEGNKCNATLDHDLQSLAQSRGTLQNNLHKMCQFAATYLSCVYTAVESHCGEEAAKWQRGLDKRILEPILGYISCDFNGKSSSMDLHVIIPIAVVVSLVLLLIMGAMVAYLLRNHTKSRRPSPIPAPRPHRSNRRPRTTEPPPPFDHVAPFVIYQPPDGGSGNPQDGVYVVDGASGGHHPDQEQKRKDAVGLPMPPPYAEKPPSYSRMDNGHLPEKNSLPPDPRMEPAPDYDVTGPNAGGAGGGSLHVKFEPSEKGGKMKYKKLKH